MTFTNIKLSHYNTSVTSSGYGCYIVIINGFSVTPKRV